MKIWCRYKNPKYVIEAQEIEYVGPRGRTPRRVPGVGLSVEFVPLPGLYAGSLLDTEAEAAKRGWDDETRERVERHLMGHPDWGFALKPADDSVTGERPTRACGVVIMVEGGVRPCGRPAEDDFCDLHRPMAREPEPEPEPEPEAVPEPEPGSAPKVAKRKAAVRG